jgi:hypothetical protein
MWNDTDDMITYQRQEGSWVQITTMAMPIDEIPPITGSTDGQYLSNDGSDSEWIDLVSLPDQSGYSGRLLTTNGSVAQWANSPIRFDGTEIEFWINGSVVASIQANGDIHAGGTVIINDPTPGS